MRILPRQPADSHEPCEVLGSARHRPLRPMRSRPGALTRPRRRRPYDTTGRQKICVPDSSRRKVTRHQRTQSFLRPPGLYSWVWGLEMTARFFLDVFCPCGNSPSCTSFRRQRAAATGEETKTSPCWQCSTYGKIWRLSLLELLVMPVPVRT
jgi:hypothetical protein